MKNLKNVLLVASVGLLGLTQLSRSSYQTDSATDDYLIRNDSTIQVLLNKVSDLEDKVYSLNTEVRKIKGRQEYIPTGTSISDLESIVSKLDSKIDKLERMDDQLESKIKNIKGSIFSTPSLSSLESDIRDLKRSSHSH